MKMMESSPKWIENSVGRAEIARHDDNFKFDENDGKFPQMDRKQCGKSRNCSSRAISPFPAMFSKDLYCRHVKTRACLGKG